MISRLRAEGNLVRGVDLKRLEFNTSDANEFIIADLCDLESWETVLDEDVDEASRTLLELGRRKLV